MNDPKTLNNIAPQDARDNLNRETNAKLHYALDLTRVTWRVTEPACLLSPLAASVLHVSVHGNTYFFILTGCHLLVNPL